MIAERWITIGMVQLDYYVLCGNSGTPGGLFLEWKGRHQFGQPWGFLTWNGLIAAVKFRLRWARLEVVSIACATRRVRNVITFQWLIPLLVRVRRRSARSENGNIEHSTSNTSK